MYLLYHHIAQQNKNPFGVFVLARSTGLEGQVSKFATLIKNFLPELACRKATWLRLFKPGREQSSLLAYARRIYKNTATKVAVFLYCAVDRT